MNTFNLLVSTSRYNETNANAELWFLFLMCGDKYPIISNSKFSGLLTASTNLDSKQLMLKIQEILSANRHFFQFILKILPIDFVCESNIDIIKNIVNNNVKSYLQEDSSFKIVLNRRKHEFIERDDLIKRIAENIKNKVSLNNPDIIINIELLGKYCGVSFLKPEEILQIENKFNNP